MISDEALFLDFQRGSQTAFDQLFARYRGPLYGFFRRRLTGAERAEDLVQETFMAVIRGAEHYRPKASVRTYLYAIALKILMSERRREPVWDALAKRNEPAANSETEASPMVRSALGILEASEREILMLREYEQLSYEEIAGALQIPVNTVRSRLFRARMAMKSALQLPARPRECREDETRK